MEEKYFKTKIGRAQEKFGQVETILFLRLLASSSYGFKNEDIREILSFSQEKIKALKKEFSYYIGNIEERLLIDDDNIKNTIFEISREYGDIKGKIDNNVIRYYLRDFSILKASIPLESSEYFDLAASSVIVASALINKERNKELWEMLGHPFLFEAFYSLNRRVLLALLINLIKTEKINLKELLMKESEGFYTLELSLLASSCYLKMDELSENALEKSLIFLSKYEENKKLKILSQYLLELGKIYIERYGIKKSIEKLDEVKENISLKLSGKMAAELNSHMENIKSLLKKIYQGDSLSSRNCVKLSSNLIYQIKKMPSKRLRRKPKQEEIDILDPYHLWE